MKIYAIAYTDRDSDGRYESTEIDTERLFLHRTDAQQAVNDLNDSKRLALWKQALATEVRRIEGLNRSAPEHNALVEAGFRQTYREILPIPTLADIPVPTLTSHDGYWSVEELEVQE